MAVIVFCAGGLGGAGAADRLVLALEMDRDLLSLAHHVDEFIFAPTMNFSPYVAGDLSERIQVDAMDHHLVATALVRIDGEVVGFATEQESVVPDPETGVPQVDSSWLITLSRPDLRGHLAVKQRENPARTFALVQEVMANPDAGWDDEPRRFLSTDGLTRVQMATGRLAPYEGGRFEEYNIVRPADFRRLGRFRARIEFEIDPAE